jgi:hypothetical protein
VQGKMGIETRNIIRDSKNTTSSKHKNLIVGIEGFLILNSPYLEI